MDRTAPAGVPGEESSALPLRRRQVAREPEAGGDKPRGWFGDPKPSESGSISSPVAAPGSPVVPPPGSPAVPSPRASTENPAAPEYGPASPGGPGRVSFGFSDGPIGGARTGRGRGIDDTGGLRRVSDDTGGLRRVSDEPSSGGFRSVGDGDDLPRRGRFGREPSGALPIVRKGGNGIDTPSWSSDSDPVTAGTGSPSADSAASVPWPESFPAGPISSAGGWERRDEPVVWSDALPAAGLSGPSMLSNGPVSGPPGMMPPGLMPPGMAPSGMAPSGMVPPRRQSRIVTAGMTLLGVVALAAVALTGVVYYSGGDNQISDILGGKDQRIVSGPLEDRTIATFEMMAATDRVQLRIADLGDELYQISSPEGTGVKPSAEMSDDLLRVDVTRDDPGVGGEVEVVLAAKVRWTIRFSGYSAERIVDLSAGRVRGIEIVGGTRRAELTLAEAAGTVPMRITGGMEELVLRAPTGSPVRIKVGGGAGTVTAGSRTLRDVAPGSTLTPKDWTTGNRYDVDAVAPVTLLTVETT